MAVVAVVQVHQEVLVVEEPDLEILRQALLFTLIMVVVVMEEILLLQQLLQDHLILEDPMKVCHDTEKLILVAAVAVELMLVLSARI